MTNLPPKVYEKLLAEQVEVYFKAFYDMSDALFWAQNTLGLLLVMPIKLIVFLIFKRLTKRDYSVQLDDIFDFGLGVTIAIWTVNYYNWYEMTIP